jgi:hypothetical protein
MKIADIIMEDGDPVVDAIENKLTDPATKQKWAWARNYDASMFVPKAKQIHAAYPQNGPDWAADKAIAQSAGQSSDPSTHQPSSTPARSDKMAQRGRQDSAGRNLKHDRYYNDRGVIPKAADATNAVQKKFRRGGEIANRFMQ